MSPDARFLPPSGFDPEDAAERVDDIVRVLDETYPDPHTALRYEDPFQLLVSVILSAQSTDEQVNRTTPALFERFPTPEDLAVADPSEVEELIYSTGFYRQKTKSIIGTARGLVERFGGEVPRTLEELTSLPGVARKTANVVLTSLWPEADHGIVVDTHVRRVSQRLALTANDDPNKIERDLMALLPEEAWVDTPHQMILLGRGPCDAKDPQHTECPLLPWCPTGQEATGGRRPKKRTKRRSPRKG